eukprot:scaffold14638_cov108-Skeletonema_marinoi.AAC.1
MADLIQRSSAIKIPSRILQVHSTRTSRLQELEEVSAERIDEWITNMAWAIRSTHHTVLKSSPGAAVFSRDMFGPRGPSRLSAAVSAGSE